MSRMVTEAEVRRAVSAACALDLDQDGPDLTPHMVVDDMLGLDAYRRYMRCPDIETLSAYAEDALSLDCALELASHARDCPVCRADIRDLQSVVRQEVAQILAATPAWTSPFVGRDEVRGLLDRVLTSGSNPFLTVAAGSGSGKTRLLLETAVEHAYLFADGVWYLSAGRETAAPFVAAEIGRAARVPLQPERSAVGQLRDFLSGKRAMLVVDDLSEGPEITRLVEDLRSASSDLCFLASGGSTIGVARELSLELPPLDVQASLESESATLFVEHVRTFRPDFDPNDESASVAAICRCAAGMPLGVEIAAARAREMEPGEIVRSVESARAAGVRGGDPLASLISLVEWSVGLLSRAERRLLEGLTVFPDTFLAEQAAAICSEPGAHDLLRRLHEWALLQVVQTATAPRYRLLRPVREFARRSAGDSFGPVEQSHRRYFLAFAGERARELRGPNQVAAIAELSADLHNLRAGMDRAVEAGESEQTGDFGLALQDLLFLQGQWDESESRLLASLESFAAAGNISGSKRSAIALGRCLVRKGRLEEAEERFRSVLSEPSIIDKHLLAEAKYGLGNVSQFAGRYDEATERIREAMSLYDSAGDRWGVADCEQSLGWLAWRQGDFRSARRLLETSLERQRERGDRYRVSHTLSCLANIAFEQGRLVDARPQFEECLALCEEIGYVRGAASALTNLGSLWQQSREFVRAEYCYERSIRRLARIGDRRTLAQVMLKYAGLALDQEDTRLAEHRFDEALRTARIAGDRQAEADACEGLGRVAEHAGNPRVAAVHFREGLRIVQGLGNVAGIAAAFCRCAALAARVGRPEDAATILTFALPMCEARQLALSDDAREILRRLEKQIGEDVIETIRQRAAAMTLEEAAELASSAMAEQGPD